MIFDCIRELVDQVQLKLYEHQCIVFQEKIWQKHLDIHHHRYPWTWRRSSLKLKFEPLMMQSQSKRFTNSCIVFYFCTRLDITFGYPRMAPAVVHCLWNLRSA